VTNFFGSVMKTLHTDSAYTGFLAAHDNETPMSTGDNLDDHFMLKGRAIARRSTIEKVNVSLSKL
jgi:GPI-anchor transamidase subunit K